MDKSFVLLDKNNNLQKTASVIVKFNFENKDYIVYSIEENEQNSQIFVSKLILNSEGKYFIDNILPEEKKKLSNVVYNIVILTPIEAKKGVSFEILTKNLFGKFLVKLSSSIKIMEIQEYYSNCSIAITNNLLVNSAVKFYDENLNAKVQEKISELPTWTAPVDVTAPTPVDINISNDSDILNSSTSVKPLESVVSDTLNLQLESVITNEKNVSADTNNVNNILTPETVSLNTVHEPVMPNPQVQKLAIISDPSLGLGVAQPNINKNKKAGFASTKYVVIGTVSIVLAIAVVVIAYVLISNIK